METGNRLAAATGKKGRRECWKEGEGTGQKTCMNDPWTWTTVWGRTVGVGCGAGRRRAKGEKLGQL